MTENMKIPKFRDEHKVTCATCHKNPVTGPLIVDPVRANEFELESKTYCFDCVNKNKDILIFIKEAVNSNKEFLNIKLD